MLGLIRKLFTPRPPLESSGLTDTGRKREHNEDCFAILDDRRIFIVADGMGGHNAGEVASRLAIETLVDFFTPQMLKTMTGNPEEARHGLLSGLKLANRRVMEQAERDPRCRGMGATLVVAFIDNTTVHCCHVGDARCYVADAKRINQVTTDHTGIAYRGPAAPDSPGSIQRNVVTMAIGFPFQQDPEYNRFPLKPGQWLLLCSDGLWNMVPDKRIQEILVSSPTAEAACGSLIHEANQAGGLDNITAVAVHRLP